MDTINALTEAMEAVPDTGGLTLTPLLVCSIAVVVLVAIVCAAVRLFNLEHVDLRATFLKLITFSCSVKGRGDQQQGPGPGRP